MIFFINSTAVQRRIFAKLFQIDKGATWLCSLVALFSFVPFQTCASAPASFSPTTNYVTSSNLTSIAVADFNHDGKIDLAAAGAGSGVSILLGNGVGSFGTATVYNYNPLNRTAVGLTTAYLNSDSNLDLVIIQDRDTNNVMVMLGNGTGGFTNLTNYTLPSCLNVVSADLNRDGKADLVVSRLIPDPITVLLGNGNGSFTVTNSYSPGAVNHLAVADVDQDGKLDLLTAGDASNSVVVLMGNGNGSFGTIRTNIGPYASFSGMAVGDINNDGNPDVVGTYAKAGIIRLWFGVGDGSFTGPTSLSVGVFAVAVVAEDVNGDGNADLVVTENKFSSSDIVILLGDGVGHFTNDGTYGVGYNPFDIKVADLDNDGRLDVVTANYVRPGSLSVLLNRSSPVIDVTRLNPSSIKLAWPNWSGYQLQYSTNLSLTNGWIAVTNVPALVGNRRVVTNTVGQSAKFFRLKQ